MSSSTRFSHDKPVYWFGLVILIWLSLFILRWTAPSDLLDKDQERPAAYMADAALNGNWIVQVDDHGKVCSKPPVYTWIGAAIILLTGRTTDFALYFPSALGVLGCCLLMWRLGRHHFSPHAAFSGAACLLLSTIGIRILYLARTDAMFSFATFLTACLGYRAWTRGRGWIWFWLSATLATLTKGPLGLVLAAGGIIGLQWKCRNHAGQGKSWREHGVGVFLFLIISLGWLWLAYQQRGDAVLGKLIGKELIGHTNWASEKFSPNLFFFTVPSLYFISRFIPWSLPAIAGLWRAWKHPAELGHERTFEVFLASYLCFGILLFSIFPHQRPDHLFPLLPAAGLLAGREMVRWFEHRGKPCCILRWTVTFWLFILIIFGIYYFQIDPATNKWFEKTAGARQLARQYESTYGRPKDMNFVDAPYGLQYYLNTMKPRISFEDAANLLESTREVVLAVKDIKRLQRLAGSGHSLHILMQWPENGEGVFHIVSNRPAPPGNHVQ